MRLLLTTYKHPLMLVLFTQASLFRKHCKLLEKDYADDKLADRTKWNPDDIIKLLEICLETHFKTLDGRIYTQTDGTPIGKSISGPLADIYMDWFENEYIYSDSNDFRDNIKIWKRSRDDIYILWKGGEEALSLIHI